MMEGSVISEEEEAMDGLRGFQEVSTHEPALRRLRHFGEPEDRRDRAQSFSLNRNLCSERERANSFTHNKSHTYLERVRRRRSQQAVIMIMIMTMIMTMIMMIMIIIMMIMMRE